MIEIVKKVWGHEEIICNYVGSYCGKRLVLLKNFQCSLHMHRRKDETFYIASGRVKMEVGETVRIMVPGDVQHIPSGTWHRFTGLANSVMFEFSTEHSDDDVERLTESRAL